MEAIQAFDVLLNGTVKAAREKDETAVKQFLETVPESVYRRVGEAVESSAPKALTYDQAEWANEVVKHPHVSKLLEICQVGKEGEWLDLVNKIGDKLSYQDVCRSWVDVITWRPAWHKAHEILWSKSHPDDRVLVLLEEQAYPHNDAMDRLFERIFKAASHDDQTRSWPTLIEGAVHGGRLALLQRLALLIRTQSVKMSGVRIDQTWRKALNEANVNQQEALTRWLVCLVPPHQAINLVEQGIQNDDWKHVDRLLLLLSPDALNLAFRKTRFRGIDPKDVLPLNHARSEALDRAQKNEAAGDEMPKLRPPRLRS